MKDYKTLYGSLVTGDWPATIAKNASGPTASDGTPYTKEFIDDLWGGRIDLMVRAGLTPDGATEASGSSQFVKSLHLAIHGPGVLVPSFLNATERALRRLLVLTGQVILISSYADLVAATYCGDTNNATADAFYKVTTSGGGTRSTSGTYFVLPDCQGLVPRGIGENTKIFPAVGGSTHFNGGTFVGVLITDMFQGHYHGEAEATSFAGGSGGFAIGTGSTANTGRITAPVNDGTNGATRSGYETRAASFAVQNCISY